MSDVDELTLIILTPQGEKGRSACDSVTLIARDGENGDGGGSVGIRRGHLPAVISLEDGSSVIASSNGVSLASYTVSGAFAMVKDNIVTVTAQSAT